MPPKIRLGLPSKGRLQQDSLELLNACDLKVTQRNSRQYIAQINALPNIEVWFQRPADIVRQVRDGTVAFGIAGYDMVAEYGGAENQIVIIHDALEFGHCTLEVIVPEQWTHVSTITDLAAHAQTLPAENPLRVVSKFERQTAAFFSKHSIPFRQLHADGALEAAPNMGTADVIVDLVQTGLTLQENRLKRIDGGRILSSQAVFFGNREILQSNPDALATAHLLLERFEAHLRAAQHYNIIANVRGDSPEAVARKLHRYPVLSGLQGPTISPVYPKTPGENGWHAISLVVHRSELQTAIEQLRAIGGSGVVVLPALFIFEEEPERWKRLNEQLVIGD